MDKQSFSKIITVLCEAFQVECTKSLLQLYWLDLSEFSIEQLDNACTRLRRGEGRDQRSLAFMPRAGEIRQFITGNQSANAQDEWAKIIGSIGKSLGPETYHANNPPTFSDAKTRRALQVIGGYKAVCLTPFDEQQWLQKRFVEQYEAADSSFARMEHERIGRDESAGLLESLNAKALSGRHDH